jgi:hypothetical protein
VVINNDPFKLKAWRIKNYKKPRKNVWDVLLTEPKIKKEG